MQIFWTLLKKKFFAWSKKFWISISEYLGGNFIKNTVYENPRKPTDRAGPQQKLIVIDKGEKWWD